MNKLHENDCLFTVLLEIPGTEIPGNFSRNGVIANTANSRQFFVEKSHKSFFFLKILDIF